MFKVSNKRMSIIDFLFIYLYIDVYIYVALLKSKILFKYVNNFVLYF